MLTAERKAALQALGCKVPLHGLPKVQPVLLLQVVIGLSQVLNGAVPQPESVAQGLIADAQRRLRLLRAAAPHLDLSFRRILAWICSHDHPDHELVDEESALQAVLEMCLGLVLQWLSRRYGPSYPGSSSLSRRYLGFSGSPFSPCLFSSHFLFRARSCLIA